MEEVNVYRKRGCTWVWGWLGKFEGAKIMDEEG